MYLHVLFSKDTITSSFTLIFKYCWWQFSPIRTISLFYVIRENIQQAILTLSISRPYPKSHSIFNSIYLHLTGGILFAFVYIGHMATYDIPFWSCWTLARMGVTNSHHLHQHDCIKKPLLPILPTTIHSWLSTFHEIYSKIWSIRSLVNPTGANTC